MPCLVLTGHPSAGKTTLAHVIRERALLHYNNTTATATATKKKNVTIHNVVIINEETACPGQTRQECYGTSQAEKVTRGALKGSLDRALLGANHNGDSDDVESSTTNKNDNSNNNNHSNSNTTLVILDSLNYIKGFRYELYCLSKAAQEQHGVVWVLNSLQVCRAWNEQRRSRSNDQTKNNDEMINSTNNASSSSCNYYSDELMEELFQRYEPPDERNRWDRPLFCIDLQQEQSSTTSSSSQQALEKSVYNMHSLSSVLLTTAGNNSNNNNSHSQQPETTGNDIPPTKKQPKARFKRAKKKSTEDPSNDATTTIEKATTTTASTSSNPLDSTTGLQSKGEDSNATASATAVESTVLDSNDSSQQPSQDQDHHDKNNSKTLIEQVDEMLETFLHSTQRLTQGMSTQQHAAHADSNLMHILDIVTQQVERAIRSSSASSSDGTTHSNDSQPTSLAVRIPSSSSSSSPPCNESWAVHHIQVQPQLLVTFRTSTTESTKTASTQLSLWRRQYLQWCSTHPPANSTSPELLAQEFCRYLETKIMAGNESV